MTERQPTRFGKYLLLERIGVGGMAEVFKAKIFGVEGFERLVAIKRILPHLVEDDDFVNMFIDEAKIAVRLNHPNIVGIQDLGKAEGTLYIAMEFVQGKDLRALYDAEKERSGRTPIAIACHIVMKMCEALHHAHFATGPRGEPLQVIHRDVSPQNVLVSFDGEVKVADFGLAKARGRMVQTQAGVVKGKLAYMSPEQLRGEDIDHRVDVFGLGIVLFELLAGERLFLGPSDMDTLRRVYDANVPPMRDLNPDVHPELERVARRALAKDRDQRYQTALELHDDLQAFVYGHGFFAGTSSLRRYISDAFPESAPAPAELPPFAAQRSSSPTPSPPPALEPRPTHRPPALRREEEPPAAGEPASAHGMLPPPPSRPAEALPFEGSDAAVYDVDDEVYEVAEVDERPTDRPPPPEELPPEVVTSAPAVVTRRVVSTGRPPPPESSGTVPAPERERFPSQPPGLYDDDFPTHPLPEEVAAAEARGGGSDTSPAPRPEPGTPLSPFDDSPFDDPAYDDPWADDEPTEFIPNAAALAPTELPPAAEDGGQADEGGVPSWDDDATVVADRRSGGHG